MMSFKKKVYASCLLIYRTYFGDLPEDRTDSLYWTDHS